jgi:hypothetical protein
MSFVKRLRHLIGTSLESIVNVEQIMIRNELRHIQNDAGQDTLSLVPYGRKIFAQTDEDGIIAEIFRRIGVTSKTFIEFGIGDGLENNSLALLFQGWRGLWIDASEQSVSDINRHWKHLIDAGRLTMVRSFITRDNIDELITTNFITGEIDLLSVDIDGNDWHVLNAISCVQPRVIIVEYNAKFPPPTMYCMSYNATHGWAGDDNFGASLQFFATRLSERGYDLVGCNAAGVNAFFVRREFTQQKFAEPFTAEKHYQPARYHLTKVTSGHRASHATLARAMDIR